MLPSRADLPQRRPMEVVAAATMAHSRGYPPPPASIDVAPVPTPEVLWRKPPVLALAALPGTALGRLGEPSAAPPAAWAAAGAAARILHDAPLPPWPGPSPGELASRLAAECEWLVASGVLPAGLVTRNRQLAETALRPWTPVFIHGDLQVDHVWTSSAHGGHCDA